MFIRSVQATNFKPFSGLRVELESRPRLVVACGMNGTGKSSFIDALSHWRQLQHFGIQDMPYYSRGGLPSSPGASVAVTFHGESPQDRRGAIYVRTAQRVTVEFNIGNVGQPDDVLADPGPRRSTGLTRAAG